MTTPTTTTLEEIGRKLAEIAVDVNENGPPDYRKYLPAFVKAAEVITELEEDIAGTRGFGIGTADEIPGLTLDAYDREVRRLLAHEYI